MGTRMKTVAQKGEQCSCVGVWSVVAMQRYAWKRKWCSVHITR